MTDYVEVDNFCMDLGRVNQPVVARLEWVFATISRPLRRTLGDLQVHLVTALSTDHINRGSIRKITRAHMRMLWGDTNQSGISFGSKPKFNHGHNSTVTVMF